MSDPVEYLAKRSHKDESGCIIWGQQIGSDGYGWAYSNGKKIRSHRLAYIARHGEIPDGMTVDHMCFNPVCINPDHLRLLTHMENSKLQRKAMARFCQRGHEFTEENTAIRDGRRKCRECKRMSDRLGYWRRKRLAELDAGGGSDE